jgi:hypothetical protein
MKRIHPVSNKQKANKRISPKKAISSFVFSFSYLKLRKNSFVVEADTFTERKGGGRSSLGSFLPVTKSLAGESIVTVEVCSFPAS